MSAQAAKKEPAVAAAKEGDGGGAKKSKLPLIIAAAVVVLGGGGAGAYLAFKPKAAAAADAPADKGDKSDKAEKAAKKGPPLYYKFDPAFVVNFGGEGSARYLQVTVEAMARDQTILNTLKDDEPAVRNDLVMLFSAQENGSLMSQEGKDKLRGEALDAVRKVLNGEGAKGSQVEAVYFTSFVIQ